MLYHALVSPRQSKSQNQKKKVSLPTSGHQPFLAVGEATAVYPTGVAPLSTVSCSGPPLPYTHTFENPTSCAVPDTHSCSFSLLRQMCLLGSLDMWPLLSPCLPDHFCAFQFRFQEHSFAHVLTSLPCRITLIKPEPCSVLFFDLVL